MSRDDPGEGRGAALRVRVVTQVYGDYGKDRPGWFFGLTGVQLALLVAGGAPVWAAVNAAARREVARRGAVWVDTWSLFSAPGGGYTDTDRRGTDVRLEDGIHLNVAGSIALARAVARAAASPDLRFTLAASARQSVADRTWDGAVADLLDVHYRAAQGRGSVAIG